MEGMTMNVSKQEDEDQQMLKTSCSSLSHNKQLGDRINFFLFHSIQQRISLLICLV